MLFGGELKGTGGVIDPLDYDLWELRAQVKLYVPRRHEISPVQVQGHLVNLSVSLNLDWLIKGFQRGDSFVELADFRQRYLFNIFTEALLTLLYSIDLLLDLADLWRTRAGCHHIEGLINIHLLVYVCRVGLVLRSRHSGGVEIKASRS